MMMQKHQDNTSNSQASQSRTHLRSFMWSLQSCMQKHAGQDTIATADTIAPVVMHHHYYSVTVVQ